MKRILAAVTIVLSLAGAAFAQATQPDQAPENAPWLSSAAAVLLGGFIIAASIKKSKREHRD